MKVLLKALLFSALTLIAHTSYAANCQSNRSGNWSASNTWTSCSGTAPKSGDNVTIRNGHQVTLDVNTGGFNSLTINANSSLLKDWGTDVYTVTVGDLTNNGTITFRSTSNITVSNILVNYGQITFISHTGALTATGPNINYNSIVADSGSSTRFRFLNGLTNSGTLQLGQLAAINSFSVGGTLTNSGLIGASFSSGSTSLNSTGLSSNSGDLLIQNFVNTTTGLVNIGFGNPNFRVYGNFVNNNPNLNLENTFFSLIGNSYQSVTGLKQVFSFTLNNPAGAILNSNLQLGIGTNQNGGLVLLSGKLDTADSSYITYNQVCTQGNNYFHRSAGSWVTGKFLQKFAINQSGSCTFPVGTTFNYSPIILTSNSWPAPQTGSVIIQAFHGDHPDTVANTSGINPSLSLNKYWNISSPDNPNLFKNSLFSLSAHICSSGQGYGYDCTIKDFDESVASNSLIARFNNTNSWSNVNILNQTSTTLTVNSLSEMGTIIFGEYKAPQIISCVNSNINTDIAQWTVAGTYTPNFFTVPNGQKRLRLTDNVTNITSFAQLKRLFPGAGNKIVLEFNHYAYGGNGADGVTVVFSDATIPSSPGGYGGSLGYANYINSTSGFAGGWLGIGIDEFGNFPNNTENRRGYPSGYTPIAGANTPSGYYENNITIRGSGSGSNGYWLLANTGTLNPRIWTSSNTYTTISRYKITFDHSNNINAFIKVERDTTGTGNNYVTIINNLDVKKANSQQAPVPANMMISFTSGTGGTTNIHETSNMDICAFYSTPVPNSPSASNFAVLDPTILSTWNPTSRRPLLTKLSGTPFTLDIVGLKSDGTVESNIVDSSNPTKTVKLELFNYNSATSCSGYTSPISTQDVTFTTSNSHFYQGRVTSAPITINTAHREVIARVTDSSNPPIQSCSSDTFTIRPTQLFLLNTSANADSTGINNSTSSIIPTGSPFSITVGSNTVGYDGTPLINNTLLNWNNLPVGGQMGILSGSFSAANPLNGNGSTSNTFNYSEVGYFNFLSQAIYDNSFISSNDFTNGDCNSDFSNTLSSNKYGCHFANTSPTIYIGRFVPSSFRFVSTTINNRVDSSCSPTSSFTYLAEPLSVNTTIQALNHNNQIVKNYSGNFSKFDSLSFNLRANISTTNLTNKINLISQTGNFINGVNNYSIKFSLNRDPNPTNPYLNTIISSAFNDLDNVKAFPMNNDSNLDTINDSTVLGTTNFYFGRLRLANNKGSDLVPLKLALFTEYFDTNSFKQMTLDSCTTLNSSNFNTSNFVGDLVANEVSFTYPSPLKFSSGSLSILVNKPSGGDGKYAGTFELNYNLASDNKPYLQSQWTGTTSYNQNPKAQITISKKISNSKFLFVKELY